MRVALIAAIVTQIAVTCLVLVLRKPPTVVHAQTTIPVSLTIPLTVQQTVAAPSVVAPPPSTTKQACPPLRTDAPRAKALHPPQDVNRVFASRTNAGWIAAWDEEHVLVSTDAGVTFSRVLDGPGKVNDVTFDCFGNVIALRDRQLGIREGTREHWQHVPGMRRDDENDHAVLVGGGPDVVVIGVADDSWLARLGVSPDRGSTWWYRDLVGSWESANAEGYQASDGAIHLALTTADCMSDPVFWFRIRDGKVESEDLGSIGTVAVEGDRIYMFPAAPPMWKRFGETEWHSGSKRGEKLMRGSVDAAGRVWSIAETKDGEAAWAVVAD